MIDEETYTLEDVVGYFVGWLPASEIKSNKITKDGLECALHNALSQVNCINDGIDAVLDRYCS